MNHTRPETLSYITLCTHVCPYIYLLKFLLNNLFSWCFEITITPRGWRTTCGQSHPWCGQLAGPGPTRLRTRARNRDRLENRSHVDWIGLDLFNDDTRPSGHISRPTQVNVSHNCFHSLNNYSSPIILSSLGAS